MATYKKISHYQQFKSSWLNWQAKISKHTNNQPLIGVAWGNSDYFIYKIAKKSQELWHGQVVTLHCGDMTPKHWSSIIYHQGLSQQPILYIIKGSEELDLTLFQKRDVKTKGLTLSKIKSHGFLFCLQTKSPRKPQSFFAILPQETTEIIALALRPYELDGFAKDLCRTFGLKLTEKAFYYLKLFASDKPYFLEQTLRKLSLIFEQHHLLDHHQILPHLDLIPESVVFNIYPSLAQGDQLKAERVLKDLLLEQKTPPLLILGALHHYLKQIAALVCEQRGVKLGEGGSKNHQQPSLPYFLKKEYALASRGVCEQQLAQALIKLAEVDHYLKVSQGKGSCERILVELVSIIAGFCHPHSRQPR
ncbi:MAG: hypothetical protein OXC40_02635 [Proteobacteria bacterium]|nr:hypothetical protein [Pseudomonadota bacterium]